MPLRVSFTLSDRDLEQLLATLQHAHERLTERDDQTVLDEARKLVGTVRASQPPDYVRERVDRLEQIVAMLSDPDWPLPQSVHPRVMSAVAYLVDPQDLIADHVPGLGYLDDAIMIELIARELKHEVAGYLALCRYRDGRRERSPEELLAKRKQLRARAQARRARELSGRRFKLW